MNSHLSSLGAVIALKSELLWIHVYFSSWYSWIAIILWIYTHLAPPKITSAKSICKRRENRDKKLFQNIPRCFFSFFFLCKQYFSGELTHRKGAQNTLIKRLTLASLLVPYPPRNISVQIVPINRNNWEEHSGNFAEEPFMGPQEIIRKEKLSHFSNNPPKIPSANTSSAWPDYHSNSTQYETASQPYWWSNEAESSEGEEEFVNAVSSDYKPNDVNTSGKLTPEPPSFVPVQMVVTWLPPKPPTAFDGFHISIEREGKPKTYALFIPLSVIL